MIKILRTTATALMFTISIAATPNVLAASVCKGLSESACNKSNSCYWISSYKRSDGRKVSAHCRTKPSSSIKNSAKSTSQKASNKTTSKTKSVTDKPKKSATSSTKINKKATTNKKAVANKKTAATKKATDKRSSVKKKALKASEKKN